MAKYISISMPGQSPRTGSVEPQGVCADSRRFPRNCKSYVKLLFLVKLIWQLAALARSHMSKIKESALSFVSNGRFTSQKASILYNDSEFEATGRETLHIWKDQSTSSNLQNCFRRSASIPQPHSRYRTFQSPMSNRSKGLLWHRTFTPDQQKATSLAA
jgi:hypothetical protein